MKCVKILCEEQAVEEWIAELGREWDRTRYPDDPAKETPKFTGWDEPYNLVFYKQVLGKLLSK